MILSNEEFKNGSRILQATIVVFFVATAAAFVACAAFFTRSNQELTDLSTSALFILLGIQNFLSLISGFHDGSFVLFGRGQPLIRRPVKGSSDFRRIVIVNSIFVTIALIHVIFTYFKRV